jgi:urease accessory protein
VLRTGWQLFGVRGPWLATYRSVSVHTPRPVAFGAVAGAAGLASDEAALISVYEDAATVASAAIKLLPVDAGAASAWIAAVAPDLSVTAVRAASCALRDDLPSLSAPLVELRSVVDHGGMLFAS